MSCRKASPPRASREASPVDGVRNNEPSKFGITNNELGNSDVLPAYNDLYTPSAYLDFGISPCTAGTVVD